MTFSILGPHSLHKSCQGKHPQMGRNVFLIEVQNYGTTSQLRSNRHPPLPSSNRTFNRLGDFSCGWVAGRGPRSLCLIRCRIGDGDLSWGFRCRFGGGRARGQWVPWLLDRWRGFPSLLVFMYISFNLAN